MHGTVSFTYVNVENSISQVQIGPKMPAMYFSAHTGGEELKTCENVLDVFQDGLSFSMIYIIRACNATQTEHVQTLILPTTVRQAPLLGPLLWTNPVSNFCGSFNVRPYDYSGSGMM